MDLMQRRNILMRGGDSTDWKALFMGMVDGTLSGDIIIPDTVTYIRSYAFSGIHELTSVVASGVSSIGGYAFQSCINLESVSLGTINAIGGSAFFNCRKLATPITLSDNVTTLGGSTFFNCYKIPWVDVGAGVTSIGSQCFRYLDSCQYVIMRPTTPPTLATLNFIGVSTGSYPIYVPDASVATYKAANDWSSLASRIFPISDLNT